MKILCLVLLLLGGLLFSNFLDGSRACAASVAINETNFPDANFRSFVRSNYDKDNDKVLSDDEISSVTRMDCDRKSIASFKGIEFFKNRAFVRTGDFIDTARKSALVYRDNA